MTFSKLALCTSLLVSVMGAGCDKQQSNEAVHDPAVEVVEPTPAAPEATPPSTNDAPVAEPSVDNAAAAPTAAAPQAEGNAPSTAAAPGATPSAGSAHVDTQAVPSAAATGSAH